MKRPTKRPPAPVRRPRRAANDAWDVSRYSEYVRALERYADYLEWRIRTPQQTRMEGRDAARTE